MNAKQIWPVEIVGRGPVALAFALLLRRQGVDADRIHLTERRAAPGPELAARAIALSGGSWQILSRIIDAPPFGAIEAVDIAVAGHGLHTRFDRNDNHHETLGYVVRYGALVDALEHAYAKIWPALSSTEPVALDRTDDAYGAGVDRLSVHAEGRIESTASAREFGQQALFTEVVMDHFRSSNEDKRAALNIAYERFREHGPLALLPLAENDHFSVVWCDAPERIDELMNVSADQFCTELTSALCLPQAASLRLSAARHAVAVRSNAAEGSDHHAVRIGNAAQTLHPVAGQGLNLGIRDALVLASCVGDAGQTGGSIVEAISDFQRRQKNDRALTRGITDRLAVLGRDSKTRNLMTASALGILDLIKPIRGQVSRHFVYGAR